jgi:hypothetical protein
VIIVNIKVLSTDDIVSKHISQIYLIAFMCVVNFNFQWDTIFKTVRKRRSLYVISNHKNSSLQSDPIILFHSIEHCILSLVYKTCLINYP